MREKRIVEAITCDICRDEIDEGDETTIPIKRSLVTPFDVCKDCYCDLEEYFREKFKEEE